ncbi:MAG: hypothetical protein HC813_03385 [Planctomycetes bacterium]|nr:hypothetical protein [Planctomycetota bacterium]
MEAAAQEDENGEVEAVELPTCVATAIDSLEDEHLRTIAQEGIDRYGGLLTRHEFLDHFRERGIRWESARFLEAFGRRGLGTVGHVDLRERGIGVDDDLLVFFQEVVERRAEERRQVPPAHDLVLRAYGDLMSDLRTALAMAEEAPLRVAKEGSVYKSVRSRLGERLQFPLQPLLDRDEITGRILALARTLGLLAEDEDGDLVVTQKATEWSARPLGERVRDAYELLLHGPGDAGTLRSHHLRQVQPLLMELLTAPEQKGRWWPGTTLGTIARNRYLLMLSRREIHESGGAGPPLAISHSALGELGIAAQDLAHRELFLLGLTEVALKGKEPVAVRLSPFGRRLLLGEKGEAAAVTKPLIVNPDFELLLLPEGDNEELLHELDRIASRTRTGEVIHLRLERERVEAVAAAGETPEAILELLSSCSRAPLPQNVTYSIQEWAGKVRTASLQRGILFTANDPAVINVLLHHPTLSACVVRAVDDRTLILAETALERQIAQELRALGVYIR